jgi:hypothetical protein
LHVKGSKIGHVLSAVGRKVAPRISVQNQEMNGEEKTGEGFVLWCRGGFRTVEPGPDLGGWEIPTAGISDHRAV